MRPQVAAQVEERLFEAAQEASRRAARLDRPVLLSWVRRVEEESHLFRFLRQGAARGVPAFYYSTPGRGLRIAGTGLAASVRPRGAGRFQGAAIEWKKLTGGRVVVAPGGEPPLAAPVALGGFAFFDRPAREEWGAWRPFGEGLLAVPDECRIEYEGASWSVRTALVPPHADPESVLAALSGPARRKAPGPEEEEPTAEEAARGDRRPGDDPDHYRRIVASAADAIRRGAFVKVVLARECFVPGEFSPWDVVERLDGAHPGAYVFSFHLEGRAFVGATPERLLSLRGGEIAAMALAGSAPRGETPEEDEAIGEALLASEKNQGEHRVVVDYLVEALSSVCARIEAASRPSLLRTPNVQHLYTPVRGELAAGTSLLELLGRVHPTPAVGGYPKEEALAYLRAREGIERGWYAGPVGWIDARGEGEFAVALRSALLLPGGASIYAGCGIVASSDPDEELEEARLKARAMLHALGRSVS